SLARTDLVCVMVVDYPNAMTYVTRDMVEESGRPGEEWLELAIDNLRLITRPDMVLGDPRDLLGIGIADAYDSARALILEEMVEEPDPCGYILSVPNRDRVFFYPVGENPFDNRFARLLIQTLKEHQQGVYAISDAIYWVHKGVWRPIDYWRNGETLFVGAP